MGQQTTTIATVRFFRQDDKPPSAPDGATWVTPVDGAGNDTSSRYVYDAAAKRWELESAVGPSEPTLGTPVAGATWRDTSTSVPKQYDGSQFVSTQIGLRLVEAGQKTVSADTTFTVQATEASIPLIAGFTTNSPGAFELEYAADEVRFTNTDPDFQKGLNYVVYEQPL